jgi:anti-anti-sigma factor
MDSKLDTNDRTLTLHITGDLISTTAEALRAELAALFGTADETPREWDLFRLDLTSAKMIDSVGLNLVVSLLKYIQKRGAKMQVVYSSPNIARTFAFTRLDKHVELVNA